jgi:hypothetical protein
VRQEWQEQLHGVGMAVLQLLAACASRRPEAPRELRHVAWWPPHAAVVALDSEAYRTECGRTTGGPSTLLETDDDKPAER